MGKFLSFLGCALCLSMVVSASELVLKDGTKQTGDAVVHPGYVSMTVDGAIYQYRKTEIETLDGKAVELDKNPIARIATTKGDILVELFEDEAPNTVANFISLAESKFYKGIFFHRVITKFMAQGGCPYANGESFQQPGTGDPGYAIADEFSPNLKHSGRGILSMANSGANTGGSQFFICFEACPWLDGKHAVFGKVVEGMEVVDRLEAVATQEGNPKAQIYFNVEILYKRDHEYKVVKIAKGRP